MKKQRSSIPKVAFIMTYILENLLKKKEFWLPTACFCMSLNALIAHSARLGNGQEPHQVKGCGLELYFTPK
ncbi:MAG: hypothetical protein CR997_12935 [Acidobacteria bacterium]|nr:MAG: hypothetical protein CR997_12935 [Acidobacteriota bacterium]